MSKDADTDEKTATYKQAYTHGYSVGVETATIYIYEGLKKLASPTTSGHGESDLHIWMSQIEDYFNCKKS